MTKAEIEKENKALKAKIRELQKTAKVASEVSGDLPDLAYGIVAVGEKKLGLVKILFDFETNRVIIDKESLVEEKFPQIVGTAKTKIVDEIRKKAKEI